MAGVQTTQTTSSAPDPNVKVMSFMSFAATTQEKEAALESTLKVGAEMVSGNVENVADEPNTLVWFSGKRVPFPAVGQTTVASPAEYCILDGFASNAGFAEHLAGGVADFVRKDDGATIAGGFAQLSKDNLMYDCCTGAPKLTKGPLADAKYISHISLKATAGNAEKLRGLLTAGKGLVEEGEPGTVFWTGGQLQTSEGGDEFAIIDCFESMEAVAAHFADPALVPTAVQVPENAALIEGGFANGVVPNIRLYEVISLKKTNVA